MHLPITAILYKLSKSVECQTELFQVNEEQLFDGIKIFDAESNNKSYCHYLAQRDVKKLCSGQIRPEVTLLTISSSEEKGNLLKQAGFAYISIVTKKAPAYVLNLLTDIFEEFEEWNRAMHEAIILQKSAQDVADIMEMVVEYPFLLLDPGFNIIGQSRTIRGQWDEYYQSTSAGYTSYQIIQRQKKNKTLEKIARTKDVVWEYSDDRSQANALFRIPVGEKIVAYGAILECDSAAVKKGYQSIVQLIIENLNLFFQHHVAYQGYQHIYEKLLRDIIQNDISKERITEQLQYTDQLNYDGRFVLYEFELHQSLNEPIEYTAEFIRHNYLVIPFVIGNHLFLLENEEIYRNKAEAEKEKKAILNFLKKYKYSAGKSMMFFTIEQIRIAAQQCNAAMAFSEHSGTGINEIVSYESSFIYDLVKRIGKDDAENVPLFSGYAVLKEYDLAHKSDLREILANYIRYDCNSTKTAARTFTHKNTILYKLKKIKELIDFDFEDFYEKAAFLWLYYLDQYSE